MNTQKQTEKFCWNIMMCDTKFAEFVFKMQKEVPIEAELAWIQLNSIDMFRLSFVEKFLFNKSQFVV